MNAAGPLLRVRGLDKRYRERVALSGFDLEVAPAEIFGLLGPNGAGKTTAFRVLTGLLSCDAGAFFWNGQVVHPESRTFRQNLGVVFQDPSVDLKLTGLENLWLGARLYGVPRAEAAVRISESLRLMGIADRAAERVERYSGGMRRRLELARVLLHQPALLVLDEPGQGIDPEALRRVWDELARLRKERGTSVLVTTHRPDEAERCDRLAILDEGRVVAAGTPDELRGRVAGDLLLVKGTSPREILDVVKARLGLEGQIVEEAALIETGRLGEPGVRPGHELVPRVAELFAPGRLESIAVRRPTLADVFAKLTGRNLSHMSPEATP